MSRLEACEAIEPATCPDCNGDGVVAVFDRGLVAVTRTCVTCDGDGIVCPACGNLLERVTYPPDLSAPTCPDCDWTGTP